MNFKAILLLVLVIACFARADLAECNAICHDRLIACGQLPPPRSSHGPTCGDELSRCEFYCEHFGHPFNMVLANLLKRA